MNEQRAIGAEMCVKALVTSDDDFLKTRLTSAPMSQHSFAGARYELPKNSQSRAESQRVSASKMLRALAKVGMVGQKGNEGCGIFTISALMPTTYTLVSGTSCSATSIQLTHKPGKGRQA